MQVTVEVKRVADGEVRVHSYSYEPEDLGLDPAQVEAWMFSDGSYSCDCNRERFWLRGDGHEPGPGENRMCGEDRYTVRVFVDGTLLLDEFEHGRS